MTNRWDSFVLGEAAAAPSFPDIAFFYFPASDFRYPTV